MLSGRICLLYTSALGIEFTHYLFLTTYIIVIPFQAQIHRYSWSIVKMATYIKVFYEENENNKLYWESFQISDVYTEYYNKFNKNIISRISRTGALQLSALSTICLLYTSLQKANRRKVLITNRMGHDRILILTDAPKKSIKQWCRNHNDEMECGVNTYFKFLEKDYYVKVLYDSATDDDGNVEVPNEDIQIIGFDEIYDLFDYYEILGIIV